MALTVARRRDCLKTLMMTMQKAGFGMGLTAGMESVQKICDANRCHEFAALTTTFSVPGFRHRPLMR